MADTSPLVFLAKIQQLELLPRLIDGQLLVPSLIEKEALKRPIPPTEEKLLRNFLSRVTVVEINPEKHFSTGLSLADTATLDLASRESADFLLADDRLLRRMADLEGIRPMGTLGVLLKAYTLGYLTAPHTRSLVSELVQEHQFRIGIEVFDAVLRRLES